MKALIKQMAPGVWTVSLIYPMGSNVGRMTYPTSDEAVKAVGTQHPGTDYVVEERAMSDLAKHDRMT